MKLLESVEAEEGVYDRIYRKHAVGDTSSPPPNNQKSSIKLGNTNRSLMTIGGKKHNSTVTIAGDELMDRTLTGKLIGDASTRRANTNNGSRSGTKTGSGGESPSVKQNMGFSEYVNTGKGWPVKTTNIL